MLNEFRSLSARGDVLGAMERMYQRSKIQEESLHYETLKHTGELPIVGVNTFTRPQGEPHKIPSEVIRSTPEERDYAIASCQAFMERNQDSATEALEQLAAAARRHENLFEQLMNATKVCSLGQLTGRMYRLGGQYRRNM